MSEKDPKQPEESNGNDPQSRRHKMIRVITVGLVFVLIIGITVASGFLIHQKNVYRDLLQERDQRITELNQQLVHLREVVINLLQERGRVPELERFDTDWRP